MGSMEHNQRRHDINCPECGKETRGGEICDACEARPLKELEEKLKNDKKEDKEE